MSAKENLIVILGPTATGKTEWSDKDYGKLEDAGYLRVVHDQQKIAHNILFDSVEYKANIKNRDEVINKVNQFFDDKKYGNVFRVKGFVHTLDGKQYEVNSTGKFLCVEETVIEGNTLAIIGEHLKLKEFYKGE